VFFKITLGASARKGVEGDGGLADVKVVVKVKVKQLLGAACVRHAAIAAKSWQPKGAV
jgi:hypothetical protein